MRTMTKDAQHPTSEQIKLRQNRKKKLQKNVISGRFRVLKVNRVIFFLKSRGSLTLKAGTKLLYVMLK